MCLQYGEVKLCKVLFIFIYVFLPLPNDYRMLSSFSKRKHFFVNILFSAGESLWMGRWLLVCLFEILTISILLIVSLKHIYLHNMGQPIRSIRTLHKDDT